MNLKKIFLFVFISFCVYSYKLIVVSDKWFPYFDLSVPGGGLAVEILEEALKDEEYELEYKQIPWSRAEEGMKNGTYDVLLNVWKTPDREENLFFSDFYISNKLVFLKKISDNFDYEGISSLEGKKIGTRRGYDYGDEFMKSNLFNRFPIDSTLQNIRKLRSNRIDLIIEDELVMKYILNEEYSEKEKQLDFAEGIYMEKELYFTIFKKNNIGEEFIADFNEGLEKMKKNGKYEEILMKYNADK